MSKIAFISAVPYGSTGRIVLDLSNAAQSEGHETQIVFGWTKKYRKPKNDNEYIGTFFSKAFHMIAAKVTGLQGWFSIVDTLRIVHLLKKFNPDIINLHILHAWYVNLPILFRYIKKRDINVVWTMHDCWAITGQCVHFSAIKCEKWISGCYHCAQYKRYPSAMVDMTKFMWRKKKKWFSNVNNMTIVTPSIWLSQLVGKSFLNQYKCEVINNGIDLDVFQPCESKIRDELCCGDRFVILGVAFDWTNQKGADVFLELINRLDSNKFFFVLVGAENADNKHDNVCWINRTDSQKKLAEIYTASDLFIIPTREDNYPTVIMESLACGTPVISFDTGGCKEMIPQNCGIVTERNDVEEIIKCIFRCSEQRLFEKDDCITYARKFSKKYQTDNYLELFQRLTENVDS